MSATKKRKKKEKNCKPLPMLGRRCKRNHLYIIYSHFKILWYTAFTLAKVQELFHKLVQKHVVMDSPEGAFNLQYILHLCLAFFSLPLKETPFSWWSRNIRNKTPATKYWTHEGIVKLTPVTMNSVRRSGQECPYAAWPGNVSVTKVSLRVLRLSKKWCIDWFWSRWIWQCHAACVFCMRQQEPYKRFSHQTKHLTRIKYGGWLPSSRPLTFYM